MSQDNQPNQTMLQYLTAAIILIAVVLMWVSVTVYGYVTLGPYPTVQIWCIIAWYFLTWFMNELNGGGIGYPYPNWTQPFFRVYEDIRCKLSPSYTLQRCGNDQDWADMFTSSWTSIIVQHGLFPVIIPMIMWWAVST